MLVLVIDSTSIASLYYVGLYAKLLGRGEGLGFYHFLPVHYYLLCEWGRGGRRTGLLVEPLTIHG